MLERKEEAVEEVPEFRASKEVRSSEQKLADLYELSERLREDHPDNPRLIEELDKYIEQLERQSEQNEKKLEIARLKEEIKQFNGTVQHQEGVERFGAQFGFNKDETYSFIEKKILEDEAAIRTLEEETNRPSEEPASGARGEAPSGTEEGGTAAAGMNGPQETRDATAQNGGGTEGGAARTRGAENPQEIVLPKGGNVLFRESFERENEKPKVWGWLKERAKGFASFGFWELHQAERFRTAKKEISGDISTEAGNLEKTHHLSLEDALREAQNMRLMREAEGLNRMDKKDYERYSELITKDKKDVNSRIMGGIIDSSMAEIAKRLEKYRSASGLKVAELEKNKEEFRKQLTGALAELQDGQIEADVKKFDAIIKDSFDPNYWSRYVYGGLEAALETVGLKILITKLAAAEVVKAKGGFAAAKEAAGESGNLTMKDSVWKTAKLWLRHHGVTHPTNSEVMQLSKQMAADNHIGVAPWHVTGSPMDIHMKQGYLLKWSKTAARLAKDLVAKHAAAAR